MLDYCRKIIELVQIEKKSDKFYLLINLSFEQEVKLYWEIDSYTAQQINDVIESEGKVKHRLSLYCDWDETSNHYQGFITKTYRTESNRLTFHCSVNFHNQLKEIGQINTISDLKKLAFLSERLDLEDNTIQEKQVVKQSPKLVGIVSRSLKPLKLILVSMFIILLTSFSLHGYYDKINKIPLKSISNLNARAEVGEGDLIYRKVELIPKISPSIKKEQIDTELEDSDSYLKNKEHYFELNDLITYHIPEGHVALTFDDGPSIYSKEIVNILNSYNVGATFFFIGLNIQKYPEMVDYVHSNGYSIGAHTMNHFDLKTLSYERQEGEILQSMNMIEEITNEETTLFRPPYGEMNEKTKDIIQKNGKKLILWNNDPRDWSTKDKNIIFHRIHETETSGSIILLHESQAMIDALPKIIEHLQEQDLKIVSLH